MNRQCYTTIVRTKNIFGGNKMAEFLEATMLICFGISWPMSVYKNIKAKTAKSMSLGFILMITLGYVAGIAAKIYTHNYFDVFIVYIINLMMVSTNIVVYFRNKHYDRKECVAA